MKKSINVNEIIRLYEIEKLSSYEIGGRLGIPPSTIRYHLRKNRKLRDKAAAQREYLARHDHQRLGKRSN